MKRTRSSRRTRATVAAARGSAPEPETITTEIGALEENILAFLDSNIEDDKVLFLEAVYSQMVAVYGAKQPSKRIYKAAFNCLQESQSLETVMASYRLLSKDLNFPTLDVVPLLDSVDIGSLVTELATDCNDNSVRSLAKALSFQYIMQLLQIDFQRWVEIASGDGTMLENTFIHQQLKSPMVSKELLKNLMLILDEQSDANFSCSDPLVESAQALISLLFDLDEKLNSKARIMHLLLEILHYSEGSLLKTMRNPALKLQLILKYFQKHGFKSAAKHMQDPSHTVCFGNLLQYVKDNGNAARSINKELLQLLLAQAFQASLRIVPRENSSFVATLCSSLIVAFDVLFPNSSDLKPVAKQALLVAKTLSRCT